MAKIYIPADGEVGLLDDFDFMTKARTCVLAWTASTTKLTCRQQTYRSAENPYSGSSTSVTSSDGMISARRTTDTGFQGLHSAPSRSF